MSTTIFMLMGYIIWTIILLFGMAFSRFHALGTGKFRLRHLTPDGENLPPFAHRIHRAYLNCIENLPMVVGVCLIAFMLNQVHVIASLAYLFLAARLAQSLVHLCSIRLYAVTTRLILYLVQIVMILYWIGVMFANS